MFSQQVTAMSVKYLKALMLQLVEWYPDLVAGAMSPEPQPTPADLLPQRCHCGRCRQMATHQEELQVLSKEAWTMLDGNTIRTTASSCPIRALLQIAVNNHNEYYNQHGDPNNADTICQLLNAL